MTSFFPQTLFDTFRKYSGFYRIIFAHLPAIKREGHLWPVKNFISSALSVPTFHILKTMGYRPIINSLPVLSGIEYFPLQLSYLKPCSKQEHLSFVNCMNSCLLLSKRLASSFGMAWYNILYSSLVAFRPSNVRRRMMAGRKSLPVPITFHMHLFCLLKSWAK